MFLFQIKEMRTSSIHDPNGGSLYLKRPHLVGYLNDLLSSIQLFMVKIQCTIVKIQVRTILIDDTNK